MPVLEAPKTPPFLFMPQDHANDNMALLVGARDKQPEPGLGRGTRVLGRNFFRVFFTHHPPDLTRHSNEARLDDDGRAGTAENCTVPAFATLWALAYHAGERLESVESQAS